MRRFLVFLKLSLFVFIWSFFDAWLQPRRQAANRSFTLLNVWWELENTEAFVA